MNIKSLEKTIRSGIPISEQMDFKVRKLEALKIEVSGGASENINVHQTAFAGSIYSICTLAAWGLTFSKLPENCALVMASAEIEYLRPVKGEIIACAVLSQGQSDDLLTELASQAKSRLDLEVTVMSNAKLAVKFLAHLHIKQH